jgi:hypothetical protein
MGAPPFQAGGVQETWALALPGDALTPLGASGTVRGVTLADGLDGRPVPDPFVPVTVNVYGVPLLSPPTVQLVAPVVEHVAPPGDAVTV